MYVYVRSEPGLFTVGHYHPRTGAWIAESDHDDREAAARRVAWLNGSAAVRATLDEALNSGDGTYRP